MTDRYHVLTVVLEDDLRSDDAKGLINAIKMLRGVLSVTPHVADIDSYAAQERARIELIKKLWDVLK